MKVEAAVTESVVRPHLQAFLEQSLPPQAIERFTLRSLRVDQNIA
jgi:hypothetical protein